MATQRVVDLETELARRIRAARALSGKEARDLASEVKISKQKLWRFERGDQIPDALELAAIAEATGQSVEFLLGVTSAEPQEGGTLPSPLGDVKLVGDEAAA